MISEEKCISLFKSGINDVISEIENSAHLILNQNSVKPVILDVDMSTDVDDICAVRIATSMDDERIIDLKGVMFSVTGVNNLSALRGMLVYDHKEDVLIGKCSIEEPDISPYWDILAEYDDGKGDIDDAVRQYRKILQEAEMPVDIVVTGYLTNLEYLLKSEPNDISSLDGLSLVKEKVGQLYVVGGSYPDGFSNNFHYTSAARHAIDYVNKNWLDSIIFSPSQTGGLLVCGKSLQDIDIERKDIVTRALYAFGTDCGRIAWDPFGVWICGLGCSDENQIFLERCNLITDPNTDTSTFVSDENGMHYIVNLSRTDYNYYNTKMDEWLIKDKK